MHHRVGSRYNARGMTDDGNVANQLEKEQILVVDDKMLFSHVQISGVVPIFWEQKTLRETIKLIRGPEFTKKAFYKHATDILETYGPCHIVNLLRYKKKKSKENLLT